MQPIVPDSRRLEVGSGSVHPVPWLVSVRASSKGGIVAARVECVALS
jgi:hypothetical protein